jgi:3-dehydrosphinganine reductase
MRTKANLKSGKVALVSGGSSGIGLAIGCALARRGMDVWLVARRQEILESAYEQVEAQRQNQGQKIGIISADVTDWGQVQSAVDQVLEKSGSVDVLVNSAGVAHPGYVQELDLKIFKWMMEVNYFGTVYMTKAILPSMLQRKSGYIVNISSLAGFIGVFGYTAYGASKFAVRGFSDALRAEMKLHGIGVSIVFPVDTDTAQLEYENQFKPPETKAISGNSKTMSPDEVAQETMRGIERGQYVILPGFEGKLLYRLSGILGWAVYMVMDQIVAGTNRKLKSSGMKEA